jgi:hypothetical protein
VKSTDLSSREVEALEPLPPAFRLLTACRVVSATACQPHLGLLGLSNDEQALAIEVGRRIDSRSRDLMGNPRDPTGIQRVVAAIGRDKPDQGIDEAISALLFIASNYTEDTLGPDPF